jgi:ribosome assembly protein 3
LVSHLLHFCLVSSSSSSEASGTSESDSSSSSSESEHEQKQDETPSLQAGKQSRTKKPKLVEPPQNGSVEGTEEAEEEDVGAQKQAGESEPPKPDFASFYLRSLTKELGEDLEKIRNAPDFKDESLPVLIHALQQGQALFSEEEKNRVMGRA